MTSAVFALDGGLASKILEKALLEDSLGIGVVNDIGRCIEKKEDMWISSISLGGRLFRRKKVNTEPIPDGWRCVVEGTLGRFKASSSPYFFVLSCSPSLGFRLLMRALGRFSAPSLVAVFASFVEASAWVAITRESSFGGLGVFDEECLRWCICAGDRLVEPVIRA